MIRSFRAKIVLGIALIQVAVLALLLFNSLGWLRKSNEQQLIQYGDSLAQMVAVSSQDALLATDLATLDSILQALTKQPDVAYARIEDANHTVLASAGDASNLEHHHVSLPPSRSHDGFYHSIATIELGGVHYGLVEIAVSIDRFESLIGEARSSIFSLAAMEIGLVACFSLLIGTLVTRRLTRLSEAAERIATVGPGVQIQQTGGDEVAQASKAFNQMSSALAKAHREFEDSIDAQRQLASDVERHRQLLKATLSAAMDAVITIDRHGHVLEYSDSAERIFGFSREEVMGKELAEFLVPEAFREAHRGGMAKFRQSGEAPVLGQRLEIPALHKDGHEFLSELTISSVEVGDETLFTAYMRDITEQKQQAQELLLAAHAFDANEAIFITDADARILRVNQAFTRITGFSEQEALGKQPTILSSGLHDKAFFESMWRSLTEQGRWSGEITNKRKNGELLPELLSISSVANEQGEATHFVAHFTDLSEQKAVEASLTQARREAESASEAKSRFLATMSHEIRTPLNAIINMNQILQETTLDEEQRNFVNAANEAGHTLMALVNNVLDFSRIEAERIEFNYEWFSARQTLQSIAALFEGSASKKMLTITMDVADGVNDEYYGEPLRFRQVVFNLLGNAIKFTEEGGVSLHLAPHAEQGFMLTVADTGIGIDPEAQRHLFEEFFQVDNDSTRGYSGTGLGLAITKQLVQRMDGSIQVSSELGKGTTFTLVLPFKGRKARRTSAYANEEQPLLPTDLPKVLLIDDSEMNRAVVTQVLRNHCRQLDCAENGKLGFEQAQREKYDLILMDMAMPVMDGLEATRRIREQAGINQQIPIIAMTANAFVEDKQACFEAGMNDFLSKPIDIALLRSTLQRWYSGSEASAEDFSQKPTLTESLAPATPNPEENAVAANKADSSDPACAKYQDIPWLDVAVLQRLCDDAGSEAMPIMLGLLSKEIPERSERLLAMAEQCNWPEVAAEAHAIKGNVATFGASKMQALSYTLELAARQGDGEAVLSQVHLLMEYVETTLAAITESAEQMMV